MTIVISLSRAKIAKEAGDRSRDAALMQRDAVSIWKIPTNDDGGPEQWVLDAISGHEYEGFAKTLWYGQPNLRKASERLAEMITPWWPDAQGKSLLEKAIGIAVMNVYKANNVGDGLRRGRLTGIYVHGLTTVTPEIANIRVSGINSDGQMRSWEYFSSPLLEWAKVMGLQELMAHATEPEPPDEALLGIKTHLIARVTDPIDAGCLAKYAPFG